MNRSDLRVVADTNLIVSAMLTGGIPPQQAIDYITQRGTILLSSDTFNELTNVLLRRRFERYSSIETRLSLLTNLERESEWMNVTETILACLGPGDNKFPELAISGQASHIHTGDSDLLVLHPFRSIPILTPRGFLSQNVSP